MSLSPLQKLLRPHRIVRPVLRLEDHAAVLQADQCVVLPHRDLNARTLAACLHHKLRRLIALSIIKLLTHLSTAHDHRLRSLRMTMDRNHGISHQQQNVLLKFTNKET